MWVSSARLSSWKRLPKKVRNFFSDALPRNKTLVFEDYELSLPEIRFTYLAKGRRYVSVARLELPEPLLSKLTRQDHHPLFVHLGISFAASHFLLSDFKVFSVACAALGDDEVRLLEQTLANALGEFRFRQGLDPSRKVRVTSTGPYQLQPVPFGNAQEKALMLNGGGKDSCVSAELLRHIGLEFTWLNAFTNSTRMGVIDSSGVADHLAIRFRLDKAIATDAAYSWGVTPYLHAICAASMIVAYVTGSRYIVTGAEHSADDPNLLFNGFAVNHQSGKTYVFESFLNEFARRSVLQGVQLFSIARPFSDLRLAEMFSHFPQYFDVFLSCNEAMGTAKWCCRCHKCAFTYLALYPFVPQERLDGIFGESLFDRQLIRRYLLELTAERSIKPWECVGTVEECRLALHWCLKKSPELQFAEWPRRADLEAACAGGDSPQAYENSMAAFHSPHSIPEVLSAPLATYTGGLLRESMARWPWLKQAGPT